jgi:hypothetical protein
MRVTHECPELFEQALDLASTPGTGMPARLAAGDQLGHGRETTSTASPQAPSARQRW